MKIFNIIITMALVLGLAASGMSFEGNGSNMPKGINDSGAGDGTGPIHDILGGSRSPFWGRFMRSAPTARGFKSIKVKTMPGNIIITVYGIGPLFYWDSMG